MRRTCVVNKKKNRKISEPLVLQSYTEDKLETTVCARKSMVGICALAPPAVLLSLYDARRE